MTSIAGPSPPIAEPPLELDDIPLPDLDELVTEDDTPVDNMYVEYQQHLLTEPLHTSWQDPLNRGPFIAVANVGYFSQVGQPAVVPDVMLAFGVTLAADLLQKESRSYFQWIVGKPPDAAIEIASDRRGGEETDKYQLYERRGVPFYIIYDPLQVWRHGVLRAFGLVRGKYELIDHGWMEELGLGLTLWHGTFNGKDQEWLRWRDRDGVLIPTGGEQRLRADNADIRAARLEAQLRALGVDPEVG